MTARGNRFYGNVASAIALGLDSPIAVDPGDAYGPERTRERSGARRNRHGPPTVANFVLSSAASTTYDVDFYANLLCATRPTAYREGEELV